MKYENVRKCCIIQIIIISNMDHFNQTTWGSVGRVGGSWALLERNGMEI